LTKKALGCLCGEHGIERGGEPGVSIAHQELHRVHAIAEVHHQVAGGLDGPGAARVGGDPGQMYSARVVLDDDQGVDTAQDDGVDV
jgi:hypothetical protein